MSKPLSKFTAAMASQRSPTLLGTPHRGNTERSRFELFWERVLKLWIPDEAPSAILRASTGIRHHSFPSSCSLHTYRLSFHPKTRALCYDAFLTKSPILSLCGVFLGFDSEKTRFWLLLSISYFSSHQSQHPRRKYRLYHGRGNLGRTACHLAGRRLRLDCCRPDLEHRWPWPSRRLYRGL